jgi:membrane protease YdiL (CAAX protease family)
MNLEDSPNAKPRHGVEVAIVLALSLGASAVYSVLSLVTSLTAPKGLAGQVQHINPSASPREWLDFCYQFVGIALAMAPVALVVYLVWRGGAVAPFSTLGWRRPLKASDFAAGFGLAAAIGVPGLGLYFGARALGLAAQVVPSDLPSYWWAVPLLLLSALRAALVEEFIVVGFLFNRFTVMGWSGARQIWVSALIRGSYHLYQGFGGFVGNLVMGLVFGWLYKKHGRLQVLVFAHFLLDTVSFVGFALLYWLGIQIRM